MKHEFVATPHTKFVRQILIIVKITRRKTDEIYTIVKLYFVSVVKYGFEGLLQSVHNKKKADLKTGTCLWLKSGPFRFLKERHIKQCSRSRWACMAMVYYIRPCWSK